MKVPFTRISRAVSLILSLAFIVLAFWAGWNSINYICFASPDVDSGTYSALGFHVLHGYVPYRDIWEQKPPMIFFIEAFAQWISEESVAGIRDFERLCGGLRGVLFFLIVRKAFGSAWLGLLASGAFMAYFFSRGIFQGGNLTEEYAAVFLFGGVYASQWARTLVGKHSYLLSAVAGFFFSLAILTKEPYLLSCLPWITFALLKRDGGFKGFLLRSVSLGAGGLLPVCGFVAYFAWHGALMYWVDTISFSFSYVAAGGGAGTSFWQRLESNRRYFSDFILNKSSIITAAAYLGILWSVITPFLGKARNFFIPAVCAEFILDYCATSLTGMGYGHYYMQIVPSFILLAACGFGLVQVVVAKRVPFVSIGLLALGAFAAYKLDATFFNTWYQSLNVPYGRYAQDEPVIRYIRENSAPSDQMWQSVYHKTRRYLEAGRLSPVRFLYIENYLKKDTMLSTGEQKIESIKDGLKIRRPKFVIISPEESDYFGLTEWLQANYRNTGLDGGSNTRLFVRVAEQ